MSYVTVLCLDRHIKRINIFLEVCTTEAEKTKRHEDERWHYQHSTLMEWEQGLCCSSAHLTLWYWCLPVMSHASVFNTPMWWLRWPRYQWHVHLTEQFLSVPQPENAMLMFCHFKFRGFYCKGWKCNMHSIFCSWWFFTAWKYKNFKVVKQRISCCTRKWIFLEFKLILVDFYKWYPPTKQKTKKLKSKDKKSLKVKYLNILLHSAHC